MGKAIATAGAVIAGAALIATGIGAAAGAGLLGAAAASSSLATGSFFGLTSIATLGQVGAGLTALAALTTKRPDVQTGGSPVQQTYDPQSGIPYAVGRTAVAGRIVYGTTAPSNNKYRLFYSVLSLGPIEGIEAFYANNSFVDFSTDGGEGAAGTYQNRMWQVRRLGAAGDTYLRFTATGTKDTPADHGGNPPEWTSAHLIKGYACALTACEYDTKKFAGDVQPLWVIYGAKVYDPRLDSTYPGGSGPCRALDEATYVYSANPWLHALTFALGRWQNGKRVMGLGAPIGSIIVSQFVEAANVADANGWVIGGTVYSTDGRWSVMQAMAQAGGGYCLPMGAQIGCVVNAPRVSIGEITSRDIVGEASAAGTKGRRDRINRVIPRYRSEDHNWEVVSAAAIEVADHITFDGGPRTREVDYTLVQDVIQAAQLARYDIENSRELEPLTFTLGPAFLGYRAGDCLTANVPELGLADQDVIVVRRTFDPTTAAVTLECRSETSAKHAYCLGQTTTAPPTPSLTPANYGPTAPDPDDWSVEGGVLSGADGELPVIIVRGVLDDVHAISVIVDYRQVIDAGPPAEYGEWTSQEFPASSLAASGDDPTVTLQVTGLVPGATYQVRVRYRTVRQVTDPDVSTDLGPVVVGGVGATPPTPDTTPPSAPSALSADTSMGSIFLRWTDPSDADLDKIEVWEATTNNRGGAVKVATVAGYAAGRNGWTRSGLDTGTTRYYALRAIDRSGNVSDWYPAGATAMFPATTDSLAIADFPADLEPVGVFPALPSPTGYTGPKTIRVAADGKLYRYVAGAWVTGVAAADIAGSIADSQVAALSASKVTGLLSDSQLAAISAGKVTGQIANTQIADGAIQTPKLAAGAVTAAKIGVGEVVAGAIAAGAVTAAKIGAGEVVAGKIAAGAISALEIQSGAVTTAKLAAGTVTANEISAGSITGDRLTAGTVSTAYIASGAISTDKLAAGAVTAPKVSAFSITADRLVVGEIDTHYIKSGAISNAGIVDWSGSALLSSSSGSPTVIGSGITVETRGGGGAYTTVQLTYFVSAVNDDPSNQVGLWINLAVTGSFGSYFTGWDSALVEPGNPATLTVPVHQRLHGAGYITFTPVAFANLTGGVSQLYATRVKLLPVAIYNS